MKKGIIIQTGVANVSSVKAGLDRAGMETVVTSDLKKIQSAEYLILPGVGAFAEGSKFLEQNDLKIVIRNHVEQNKPLLAICLGMQLLCEESEESPGYSGLGILPKKIKKFSNALKVPQLGWNIVTPQQENSLFEKQYAYFANSYYLDSVPDGWDSCQTIYDIPFVSACARGKLLACQFHPELSGKDGVSLLQRWIKQ